MKIKLPPSVKFILDSLRAQGYEAWAVGGCVRDSVLGRVPDDWDITTKALPAEIKRIFRRTVDTGIEHGTVTVLTGNCKHEVTTYRIDGKYSDNRHPDKVTFTTSLTEDLRRRDFTINAMAYNDEKGLVDPFGGMSDLQKRVIRCVGEADQRFSEDALRILRAVRFSAQLNFRIAEDTKAAMAAHAPELANISAERIYTELVKLLVSDHPEYLLLAYETGVTAVVLPEFDRLMETPQNNPHHDYNVGEHTLRALQALAKVSQGDPARKPPADAEAPEMTEEEKEALRQAAFEKRLLRVAMLLHDVGKPDCRTTDEHGVDHFKMHAFRGAEIAGGILRRLKADNRMIRGCETLVEYHDWRMEPGERAVRRAVNTVGAELFPLLLQMQWADTMAQSEWSREQKLARISDVACIFEEIMRRGDCIDLSGLAVSGRDLIDLGVDPGPQMGELLNLLLQVVLNDPQMNTREKLLAYLAQNHLT